MPNASAAGGPKTGLVAARLLADGPDHGVFLFLAPLTDECGRCPGSGSAGSGPPGQPGRPLSDLLRPGPVPRDAMLTGQHGRVAANGEFTGAVDTRRRRFLRSIGRVTVGKLSMSAGAIGLARTALPSPSATRPPRHISGPRVGSPCRCSITQPPHRLLAALADTYADDPAAPVRAEPVGTARSGRPGGRRPASRRREGLDHLAGSRGRGRVPGAVRRAGSLPSTASPTRRTIYTAGITAEGDNLAIWVKAAAEMLGRDLPAPTAAAPGERRLADPGFLQVCWATSSTSGTRGHAPAGSRRPPPLRWTGGTRRPGPPWR